MDGPLSNELDEDFYQARSEFLIKFSEGKLSYTEHVVPQLEKIKKIPDSSCVYLWFEYDLFCQVNYWQCLHWLQRYNSNLQLHWVRPRDKDWKGFGNYNSPALEELIADAIVLDQEMINAAVLNLECYKSKSHKAISEYLKMDCLDENTRLVLTAQLKRLADEEGEIEIVSVVQRLKVESSNDFGKAFQLFCKRYGYYGMGDVQFRELWDVD